MHNLMPVLNYNKWNEIESLFFVCKVRKRQPKESHGNETNFLFPFPEKNCNPPWQFQGVYQNLRKKHGFPGGTVQKENGKFQEGQLQKNRYLQQGVHFFSGKAQFRENVNQP